MRQKGGFLTALLSSVVETISLLLIRLPKKRGGFLIFPFSTFNVRTAMMAKVNVIRKKNVVRHNGDPCLVLDCQIRTPPNMASFCQMTIRNLVTGKVIHLRLSVGESFEVLDTDIRKAEFSYVQGDTYSFLDNETYESYEIRKDMIEDAINYLVPNQSYEIFFVDGNPLTVNIPASVEMKVTEAPDAVRGDSANNVQKPVTLETGLVVMVPLFIKQGEILKISTEDGSYMGRA